MMRLNILTVKVSHQIVPNQIAGGGGDTAIYKLRGYVCCEGCGFHAVYSGIDSFDLEQSKI